MAERGGRGRVQPTYVAPYPIITMGYGVFSNTGYVITEGYNSAAAATGKQGIFGLESGSNNTVFGGMVIK